jgi:hypothetical protein
MTITAQSVARRLVTTLNDEVSTRWPLSEVVRAINDAQLQIVIDRPDLLLKTATVTLDPGTRQSLPADGAKLLAVNRNANGTAVRVTNRDVLDAQLPNWHSYTASATVRHFMFDPREPKVYHVFPPATNTAQLEIAYAAYPTVLALPGVGAVLPSDHSEDSVAPTVVIGNLSIPDHLAVAVTDYAICRLLLKDAEQSGVAGRVTSHYQSYATALGLDVKSTLAAGPNSNSPFNPLRPAISTPE